jgi:hypothetical protein
MIISHFSFSKRIEFRIRESGDRRKEDGRPPLKYSEFCLLHPDKKVSLSRQ